MNPGEAPKHASLDLKSKKNSLGGGPSNIGLTPALATPSIGQLHSDGTDT